MDPTVTLDTTPYDFGSLVPTVPDPGSSVTTVDQTTNAPTWGGFLSSLATDGSSILSGLTASLTQTQAIQRAKQLQADGYITPLNPPGLNGAWNAQSLILIALFAFLAYAILKG